MNGVEENLDEGDRQAAVRRRILDAAHECFERYGVGRTRVEDVAKVAGISRPLLYTYYGDRAELIEAVINDELRRLVEELRLTIRPGSSFAKSVVDLTLESIKVARNDELLADLFQNSPYGNLATLTQQQQSPAHGYVLGLWRPLFDLGRAQGVLRTDLGDDDLIEWVMMTHHVLLLRSDLSIDEVGERFRNFVVPALCSGGTEPASRTARAKKAVTARAPAPTAPGTQSRAKRH